MKIPKHMRDSAAWLLVKEQAVARIAELRQRNDADASPEATAKLRGRIAELMDLLAADQDPLQVPESHAD